MRSAKPFRAAGRWPHAVIFIAGGALAREQHCLNDEVEFRDASGETRKLNKASLNRIIFRQRETEAGHGGTRRFLVLNNGDLLSGQLLDWKLEVRPGAGAAATGLDDLELVRFSGGTRDVAILMRNGSEQTGTLPGGSIQFENRARNEFDKMTRAVGIYIFDEVEVLDLGGTVRGVLHGFAHKGQAI